jgi:hypothetical protein
MKTICAVIVPVIVPLMAALSLYTNAQAHTGTQREARAPFTLTIAAKDTTTESGQVRTLIVSEKDISAHALDMSTMNPSLWYRVAILRNDQPVAKTKEMLQREAPPVDPSRFAPPMFLTLKPGEETEMEFQIGNFYDMTEPGQYEITLTRISDPSHRGKNIEVKSNTITMTVLPPPAT